MNNIWDQVYDELFDDEEEQTESERNYRVGVMRDIIGGVRIS